MNNTVKTKILELLKELNSNKYSRGESWNGYEVYIPEYDDMVYIGLPYVVLVKNEEVRLSTPEESMEYLEYSNPEFNSDKKLFN